MQIEVTFYFLANVQLEFKVFFTKKYEIKMFFFSTKIKFLITQHFEKGLPKLNIKYSSPLSFSKDDHQQRRIYTEEEMVDSTIAIKIDYR